MKFLYALRREVFALHARAPQNFLRSPAAIPLSVAEQRGQASLVRHGQGCGSGCGCVCDVQVAVDQVGVVTGASFTAKRVALAVDGEPLRSRAGKLLLHDCPCDTLRSLGSIATSECKGERLETLRNRMLFSPSAPPSFLRTLMRNLDAPRAAAACAQVFEAALTTALTDRPYSKQIAWNSRAAFPTPSLQGDRGTGERQGYHPRGWGGGVAELLSGDGVGWPRQPQEGGEEEGEHDGLAEVDFRDQYDDIA